MKFVDKARPNDHELVEVNIGDVVKDEDGDLYMIIVDFRSQRVGVCNMQHCDTLWYNNLSELASLWDIDRCQKVDATITIE